MKLIATTVAALAATAGSLSAAPVQWADNGHWYEYVTTTGGAAAARAAALSSTHMGLDGYLATITSAEENAFITALVPNATTSVWIGASDADSEGSFYWMDGPEAGQALTYTNWTGGEPNSLDNNEDHVHLNIFWNGSFAGQWNDINETFNARGYIVEYSMSPVPVPATLPLILAGLAGLGLMRRRA